MMKIYGMAVMLVLAATVTAHAADNMKAFPPAEKGMARYVLQLPQQNHESAFKVELVIGKSVRTDEQNNYFFSGEIEKSTIRGWGLSMYRVSKLGPLAGTRIAVNPYAPKVDRFITLGGGPYLIRYNSRLPVVVYVPEDVKVLYRIWSAGIEFKTISEG